MAAEHRPRISADWIMERIQNGKYVRLRNAIIEGDIDLRRPNPTIQPLNDFEIKLNDCLFEGRVNLSLTFEKKIEAPRYFVWVAG